MILGKECTNINADLPRISDCSIAFWRAKRFKILYK